ncbi:hypothetical protein C8A01DRAFT_19911 [Parachaetomium inaequale]|uniref:2EXR domain-containing protein n=1 Tax=Parachaetomium inaequale TaxID=2588326 RepID=A0AAN6SMT7_9PEZI|nr:hypothetical protein C8A01DRAFT_19911 [Parachaetomium inaequale]
MRTWLRQGRRPRSEPAIDDEVDVRLFNNVYSSRAAPLPTGAVSDVWAPFCRLPAELRRLVWLLFLRRHRMIDVTLGLEPATVEREKGTPYPGDLSEGAKPRYYTHRNHLGNVVSSRGYTVAIEGDRFAAWLSPLLWVNSEARETALDFYRVRLPAPRRHPGRLLYLNPEYDVLYVRPCSKSEFLPAPDIPQHRDPRPLAVLVDFICDIRAYDPKDQGIANLALDELYRSDPLGGRIWHDAHGLLLPLNPGILHPAAAASFAAILQSRLRSVLWVVYFGDQKRIIPETSLGPGMRYHFAQTFPLHRRGLPAAAFDWLEADPRPGIEFDLCQLSIPCDMRGLARGWERLEGAFGIGKRAEGDEFRFYICPAVDWTLTVGRKSDSWMPAQASTLRAELAQYLREHAKIGYAKRQFSARLLKESGRTHAGGIQMHRTMVDAETFESLQSEPRTTAGMWLFPANTLQDADYTRSTISDVSAVRPGLLLFEVGE